MEIMLEYFTLAGGMANSIINDQGTDRLCKVVELSMQCCGQILYD